MTKWYLFHLRKRTPFYVALYSKGFAYGKRKILNFDYHNHLCHFNGNIAMKQSEYDCLTRKVLNRLKSDPRFLLNLMNTHYRWHKDYLKKWHKMGVINFNKYYNYQLGHWMEKYADSVSEFWAIGMVPLFVEADLTKEIEEYVYKKLPTPEAKEALQIFMTPLKAGVVGEEHKSLLEVANKSLRERPKALIKYQEKFSWMANQLYTLSFFSLTNYRQRLKKILNPQALLKKYNQELINHHRDFNFWMKKIKPNQRIKLLVETLNEAIYYRSWRGERAYQSAYFVLPVLKEIARRLKLKPVELMHCLPREIILWLKTGRRVPIKKIHDRQQGFVYLPTPKGKILTGQVVSQWEQKVAPSVKPMEKLTGQVAYPGIVKGKVVVVRLTEELAKVKMGDILVTPLTSPLYVSILNKVKAIVTEEGGVLSHASVISRELKIPCIIGTKIATQIFKDGDMVEVDAERGVVRKI